MTAVKVSGKRRPNPPTHRAIAKAWNKDMDDVAHCFACNYTGSTEKSWTRPNLVKAHVVPYSLNGSNEPDNFVLLCVRCHELNPETTSRQYFCDWLEASPKSLGSVHYLALGHVHTWAQSGGMQANDSLSRDLTGEEFKSMWTAMVNELQPNPPFTPGTLQVMLIDGHKRALAIVNEETA